MHVRVDESGHDHEVAVIDVGRLFEFADAFDFFAANMDRRRAHAARRDHSAAAQDHFSSTRAI